MATEELLSLKWNNHQSHFVDILTFLREKDMFIDVTIACGGKVYSAHKFVLSTCSDYFKQIFTRNPCSNPIVFMKDVSCRDIEALLDFMYHGEVNVPQSSLGSLIKTAEGLQIKGLAVPDDPPQSDREQERDKRGRDNSSYLENPSPPPKRRVRERNSPAHRNTNHQSHHPNVRSNVTPVETSLNINDNSVLRNDSPGSVSEKLANNIKSNDSRHSMEEEDRGVDDDEGSSLLQPHDSHTSELGAGPSGLPHSKQEQVDIKQEEDIVELGEDDDDGGDWGGGGGMGDIGDDGTGGGGGNDSLSSADNTVNFSDVLLPHTDGSMGGGAGTASDSAMGLPSQWPGYPAIVDSRLWGDSVTTDNYVDPLRGGAASLHADYRKGAQYRRAPYTVCPFCGLNVSRANLQRHIRTHTGLKLYSCDECAYKTGDKSNYRRHMSKLHHKPSDHFSQQDEVYEQPREVQQSDEPGHCSASATL